MAWPPNPNKEKDDQSQLRQSPQNTPPTGQEWRLLEKALMASIDEQKKARKWGIFFKLLTFAYIIFVLAVMGRGCATTPNTKVPPTGATEPHLAVIDVHGVISSGTPANAEDVGDSLKDAFESKNAKAVVLNINSPGGSPVQSDEIWQTIMDLRKENPDKKVYAVIGDIGASGAYYIASAADEIWVNPSSLVGSIGVIMSSYNVEKLLDKAGIQDRTITAGEYKDILSMSRPITDEEKVHIQKLLDTTHQNFIDAVKAGRGDKLKNPDENKLFSGLFWTGKQSVELGLADKLGGINQLEKELKIDKRVNYTYQDPMQALFDRFGVQVGKGLGQGIKAEFANEVPNLK